ncbi:Plexin-B1 [Manis pentadactyla]|nr:Plexin-B1 [Manis pentadactyla]
MKANQTLLELSSRDIDSNQKSITSYLKVIQRLRKFPFFSVLQDLVAVKEWTDISDGLGENKKHECGTHEPSEFSVCLLENHGCCAKQSKGLVRAVYGYRMLPDRPCRTCPSKYKEKLRCYNSELHQPSWFPTQL